MKYQHQVIFLRHDRTELCAEMDSLAADGWEFVAWLTEWPFPQPSAQREALVRRPAFETPGEPK